MTALAADRDTRELASSTSMPFEDGVAASSTIFQGALVVIDADGHLAPGTTALNLVAAGVAQEQVVNAGADNAVRAKYRSGMFLFVNDTGTPVDEADEGTDVYIVDDQTVSADATGRSVAGLCHSFSHDGGGLVAVHIKYPIG